MKIIVRSFAQNPKNDIYEEILDFIIHILIIQSLLLIWLNAASDSGGKKHVWLHDGNTLGMFSTELGINE